MIVLEAPGGVLFFFLYGGEGSPGILFLLLWSKIRQSIFTDFPGDSSGLRITGLDQESVNLACRADTVVFSL